MQKITNFFSKWKRYQMIIIPFLYNQEWVVMVIRRGNILVLNETFHQPVVKAEFLEPDAVVIHCEGLVVVFDLMRDFGKQLVLSLKTANNNDSVSFKKSGGKWVYEIHGVIEFNTELPLYQKTLKRFQKK